MSVCVSSFSSHGIGHQGIERKHNTNASANEKDHTKNLLKEENERKELCLLTFFGDGMGQQKR